MSFIRNFKLLFLLSLIIEPSFNLKNSQTSNLCHFLLFKSIGKRCLDVPLSELVNSLPVIMSSGLSPLPEGPLRGGLLSLFLHSPLTGLCLVCGVGTLSVGLWDKCQAHVDKFLADAAKFLMRAPSLGELRME